MADKKLRIALGSDERTDLVDYVIGRLEHAGHTVDVRAPQRGATVPWPEVAESVAASVSRHDADQGVLFCWTGTGVSMAANKVPGVRAALCSDAQTAAGARKWNDANILVMSLRATSPTVAGEMLDAWFSTHPDPNEAQSIAQLAAIESRWRAGPRGSSAP